MFFRVLSCIGLLLTIGKGATGPSITSSADPPSFDRYTIANMLPPRFKEPPTQELFEDFDYASHKQMISHGWIIRTATGWPGIPGATWATDGVSLVADPDRPGNRLLRMTSSTDGSGASTRQTQICHQRKYLEGTYAARVRFVDLPSEGPSGDQLVESFYTISPLKAPMDPDYSELDFEYLPVGGWGSVGPTLYATSWRTFSPEPNWQKDTSLIPAAQQAGWHTLVTQVSEGTVNISSTARHWQPQRQVLPKISCR